MPFSDCQPQYHELSHVKSTEKVISLLFVQLPPPLSQVWLTNLRCEVHHCPAVPKLANNTDLVTMSRSASWSIKVALFPPSSRIFFLNYSCTITPTFWPTYSTHSTHHMTVTWPTEHTLVLPVNESRLTLLSLAMASPTSAPPLTVEHTAPGIWLASSTCWTILVTASETSGADGAPFLREKRVRSRFKWKRFPSVFVC